MQILLGDSDSALKAGPRDFLPAAAFVFSPLLCFFFPAASDHMLNRRKKEGTDKQRVGEVWEEGIIPETSYIASTAGQTVI